VKSIHNFGPNITSNLKVIPSYHKMSLVPIKLIKDISTRNRLLKIKGETPEIDKNDYIESRITTNARARNLMAIEDASEMAKDYLHREGFFTRFGEDIIKESGKDFKFSYRKTNAMERKRTTSSESSGIEYILMEHSYPDGSGHYGMAKVDHDNKTAVIYDSMTDTDSDFEEPLRSLLSRRYKISMRPLFGCYPQPTGGFVSQSFANFKNKNSMGLSQKKLEEAFVISQYDELSQHHFCYMESFLVMMTDLGILRPGPKDPRERLEYIKKFIWGVIHEYVPKSNRRTAQWKYFEEYFLYIMETTDSNGKRLPMRDGMIQLPPSNGNVRFRVRKIKLPT
jgi:hypothetical protein